MKGSCLCNAVQFEFNNQPREAIGCHCIQCRKQSGHYFAATQILDADLTIFGEVRWYASSDRAKRGFCPNCGSFLFWKHLDEDTISIAMGSLDGATGIKLQEHIFMAFKGDYYDIADGLPQHDIVEGVSLS